MTFKDQVREDIDSVFFNFDEFADEHEINGAQMTAIIDENSLEDHPSGTDITGVFAELTAVYVKADEYGALPKRGASIVIDGLTHRVVDAVSEMGVYTIKVERWRSNASSARRY